MEEVMGGTGSKRGRGNRKEPGKGHMERENMGRR